MRLLITNDVSSYWQGLCDGIQFKDVSKEDAETLKVLCEKYGKNVDMKPDLSDTYDSLETLNDNHWERKQAKEKKVWVHNKDEAHRVNQSDLQSYLDKGFVLGKKAK